MTVFVIKGTVLAFEPLPISVTVEMLSRKVTEVNRSVSQPPWMQFKLFF